MDAPLVSAVIVVHNAERFIADCITSALAQTWPAVECIVVDDGSTDGTAAVVQSFDDPRVRYVAKVNGGVSSARNLGVATATGEYVAFLDGDDAWLPTKLEEQVRVFQRDPSLGMVYCGYAITDAELAVRTVIRPERRRLDLRRLVMLEGNGIALGITAMVSRSVLEEVGGFNEALSTSADLEFFCRVAAHHPVEAVPEPLALYRTHGDQMHANTELFEHDMTDVQARYLPGSRPSRRARSNLYTRVFFYEVAALRPRQAARAMARALTLRPDRLVVLPLAALGRRSRRRVRKLLGKDRIPPLRPAGRP